jgi:hypothetical protein
MSAGDHLVLRAGVFRITIDVLDTRPPRDLTLDVGLPFGTTNHEQIQITRSKRTRAASHSTDASSSRQAGEGSSSRKSSAGGSSPDRPTR